MHDHYPTAHIEKAATERGDYERKSGNFICSEDTPSIRQVRFAPLRETQKEILKTVDDQDDRTVDWFVDVLGKNGKSFLSAQLWERGKGIVVPRSECTAQKISAFLCSSYRGEEYVVVDIPRSRKNDDDIYEVLEEIKDGLVFDHRYTGRTRNIRGVKLIVFANREPAKKQLSADRWRVWNITGLGELQRI